MNHFYIGRPSHSVGFIAGSFNESVRKVIVDDGYAYVFGFFTTYRGIDAKYMAKISIATGNLDSTFNVSTGFNGPVLDAVLDGGYLYIVGGFESYKGTTRNGIAKVSTTDASVDSGFNSATAFNRGSELPDRIAISGSYLYVIGSFFTYKGTSRGGIAQISKTDASLGSYFSGTGFNMSADCLTVDGTDLYVAGAFDTYTNTSGLTGLAKFDLTSGSLVTDGWDTGLFTEIPTRYPYSILCVGNYLYLVGNFTTYKGTTRNGIVKVSKSTAAMDATFDPATGFASGPLALASDGTDLYAGGGFTSYNGTSAVRVAKLSLSDASIDESFTTATGANSTVRTLALGGSSLFIGGDFTTFKGAVRNRMTRVSSSDATNNSY